MTHIHTPSAYEIGDPRGGRPLSAKSRAKRLRIQLVETIGAENMSPSVCEEIARAVDLHLMALQMREAVLGKRVVAPKDMLAVLQLEETAGKAVERLLKAREVA